MNFSSHQEKLLEHIKIALTKSKKELVNEFRPILSSANKLYKTDRFTFWLKALGEIELEELPITNFGHREAECTVMTLRSSNRNIVMSELDLACIRLFTYSHESIDCNMQSTFHFYFNVKDMCVYKISELGIIDGKAPDDIADSRVAKLSEIPVTLDELYI